MRKIGFLTLALASLAFAQEIPATPAGKQLKQFLEIFNRGDADEILKMHQTAYAKAPGLPPASDHAEMDNELRRDSGGFELRKIVKSEEFRVVALLREKKTGRYAEVELGVEQTEPYRINLFQPRLVPAPQGDGAAPLSDEPKPGPRGPAARPEPARSSTPGQLRERLADFAAKDEFAGSVLIARNGQPAFAGSFGFADRDAKRLNNSDTKFNLGSMNKMFTAVAIAQLAEAGKLKFEDTLGTYLKDYPNKELAGKVTIHHLLTHSGGTGDYFGPQFAANADKLRTLQDYVDLYGGRAPAFEPGARFAYSNYGFILLGRIIEVVSGKSYYDYVQQNIYHPAGMTNSGSPAKEDKVDNRAIGYVPDGGKLRPNHDTLPYRGASAGGGYSTVNDLLKFAQALTGHKLLNEEYTRIVTSPKIKLGPNFDYGYGFGVIQSPAGKSIGHNGGAPGIAADFKIYPETNEVAVVLMNVGTAELQRFVNLVEAALSPK